MSHTNGANDDAAGCLTLLLGNQCTGKTHWANANGKVELYGLNGIGADKIELQVERALARGVAWGDLAISESGDHMHGQYMGHIEDWIFKQHLNRLWPGRPVKILRFY